MKPKTLEEALEYVFVGDVDDYHVQMNGMSQHMVGWYYVGTEDLSVIAYFHSETDAMRFRLDYINQILNPVFTTQIKEDDPVPGGYERSL